LNYLQTFKNNFNNKN